MHDESDEILGSFQLQDYQKLLDPKVETWGNGMCVCIQ